MCYLIYYQRQMNMWFISISCLQALQSKQPAHSFRHQRLENNKISMESTILHFVNGLSLIYLISIKIKTLIHQASAEAFCLRLRTTQSKCKNIFMTIVMTDVQIRFWFQFLDICAFKQSIAKY